MTETILTIKNACFALGFFVAASIALVPLYLTKKLEETEPVLIRHVNVPEPGEEMG